MSTAQELAKEWISISGDGLCGIKEAWRFTKGGVLPRKLNKSRQWAAVAEQELLGCDSEIIKANDEIMIAELSIGSFPATCRNVMRLLSSQVERPVVLKRMLYQLRPFLDMAPAMRCAARMKGVYEGRNFDSVLKEAHSVVQEISREKWFTGDMKKILNHRAFKIA